GAAECSHLHRACPREPVAVELLGFLGVRLLGRRLQLVDGSLHLDESGLKSRDVCLQRGDRAPELADLRISGAQLLLRIARLFGDRSVQKLDVALETARAFIEAAGLGAILDSGDVLRGRGGRRNQQHCRREQQILDVHFALLRYSYAAMAKSDVAEEAAG